MFSNFAPLSGAVVVKVARIECAEWPLTKPIHADHAVNRVGVDPSGRIERLCIAAQGRNNGVFKRCPLCIEAKRQPLRHMVTRSRHIRDLAGVPCRHRDLHWPQFAPETAPPHRDGNGSAQFR